jgi:hypothetical protein
LLTTPEQSSVAVVAAIAAASAAACDEKQAAMVPAVTVGPCVSCTVMVCAQLVLFPQLSAAVQVRVIT